MDEFDQRINDASEELRQSTKLLGPPPVRRPVTGPTTRWVAFAAGASAVVLAAVFLPGLIGGPVASPPDTTQTPPPTTTITSPTVECSSTGVAEPGPVEGIPLAVSAKRHALIRAALSCDFDYLERLAAPEFRTDFGGGGIEMFRQWEDSGEGKLGVLLLLLDMSWGVQEITEPGIPDHYAWPRAFIYDRWEDIPTAELDELLAIYTREELDQLAGFGSYAGWRTGIDATGEWRFFIAGD
jgi:hypothetical protein